jgi:hypothetical protein
MRNVRVKVCTNYQVKDTLATYRVKGGLARGSGDVGVR